ncbi:MAG TPA: creatininase family protein [Thermoplasmata archaeon]|nr:creatininase family protein [Thermoplasmata archaeon]
MAELIELDSRTFERRLLENPVVIVPVGALEAHGSHLPLGADQIQAEATARALASRVGAIVAPTIPYGVCFGARNFPGTVDISLGTLARYTEEVLTALARQGAHKLLVLSGHAAREHIAALRDAADRTMRAVPGARVAVLSDYDFVYERRGQDAPATDGHGGMLETSRVLAMRPELVGARRPAAVRGGSPFVPGPPSSTEWPESVAGDPQPATAELGARVQAYVLDRLEATVRELWTD